jgi:hypothetical protein
MTAKTSERHSLRLTEPVPVRLSSKTLEALRKRSREEEITIADLIRRAIKALLDGKVKV